MWGLSNVAQKIRSIGTARPKASDLERLAVQLATAETEHAEQLAQVKLGEATLQEAILAALDGADEENVAVARESLRAAREQAGDLEHVVVALRSKLDRTRGDLAAAQRAAAIRQAQDGAAVMRDAMRRMTVAATDLTRAGRDYWSGRDRMLLALPNDMRPRHLADVLINPTAYLIRFIGSRGPLWRAEAQRTFGNLEALSQINEPELLLEDGLAQIFPDETPPRAA